MRKEFRDLISPERFSELVDSFTTKTRKEKLSLAKTRGRITSQDFFAKMDVPPFNRSLMDGYALRASDSYGADEENPASLEITGEVEIGKPTSLEVIEGRAVEIATGAEIPKGANSVVMVEDTDKEDNQLLVKTSVVPGENILPAGSDIASGDLIVRKGKQITPMKIAKLAACGFSEIEVYKRPKVGIISTGPELVPAGKNLKESEIYDTNSPLLSSGVKEAGGNPVFLGIVNDDVEEMSKALERGSKKCDLLISSGGTSAGPRDMVYEILQQKGEVLAHGVKIKPGKPTVLGRIDKTPFFGLPGNPSSAYTVYMNFAAPLIRRLTGREESPEEHMSALLAERTPSEGGRTEQKFVGIIDRGEVRRVYPINKASGAITLLSQADGYITIPEGTNYLEKGEEVNVSTFTSDPRLPRLLFLGSNCVGLNQLLKLLPFEVRSIDRGSLGGVEAIANSIADVAGIHIWNPDGYNIPTLKDRSLKNVELLRGYTREQGLILPSGNPKGINSVADLITKNLSIVNRTTGSGTRILFDYLLKEVASDLDRDFQRLTKEIPGYEIELSTHNSVAAAVRDQKAEAGIGIRPAAEDKDLHFVKITEENFDFLSRAEVLSSQFGKEFRSILASSQYNDILHNLTGIYPDEKTGDVIYSY